MKEKFTYLDSASTTKLDQRVLEEMLPYLLDVYGNASSKHNFGLRSKKAIEHARFQVSQTINCDPKDVIFTSGSTESINLALKGFVESNYHKGNHIITVKTEHKAVLSTCKYLETKGIEVTYLNVDRNGLISIDELRESIRDTTVLIVIMYVNNETGVIQPIEVIGALAREMNITFFCDATQAISKIPVDVEKDNIDMLCFSGHKINGPKGIGVLYKNRDVELTPLIHGGEQEDGYRSGTYNTPSIVGFGKACEICNSEMLNDLNHIESLNNYLISSIEKVTAFEEVSKKEFRVASILNIIIPNLNANIFIDKYSSVAVSNGSACNSEVIEESHVIQSMLPQNEFGNNYLRISINKFTSQEDIDILAETLKNHLEFNYAK